MVVGVIAHIGGLVVSVVKPTKNVFEMDKIQKHIEKLYNVPSVHMDHTEADYDNGMLNKKNYICFHGSNPVCTLDFYKVDEV